MNSTFARYIAAAAVAVAIIGSIADDQFEKLDQINNAADIRTSQLVARH